MEERRSERRSGAGREREKGGQEDGEDRRKGRAETEEVEERKKVRGVEGRGEGTEGGGGGEGGGRSASEQVPPRWGHAPHPPSPLLLTPHHLTELIFVSLVEEGEMNLTPPAGCLPSPQARFRVGRRGGRERKIEKEF